MRDPEGEKINVHKAYLKKYVKFKEYKICQSEERNGYTNIRISVISK